jgi:aspartyl-tRNA synthetase
VIALALPGGGEMTRREFDEWTEWAKQRGAKGLAWGVVEAPAEGAARPSLRSPLTKFMSEASSPGCCARPVRRSATRCSSAPGRSASRGG